MLVVAGLLLFCGISVLGPVFGTAGEFATNTLLGLSGDQEVRNKKRALDTKYTTRADNKPILLKAANCCESPCNATWDYKEGRCLISTQNQNACLQACIAKP